MSSVFPDPPSKNYLYHSFVRTHEGESKEASLLRGLSVLASILDNGLLLTPERFEFEEGRSDGSMHSLWVTQTRACLTLIEPRQLIPHTRTFGSISLEWEVEVLQREGAFPVSYIPVFGAAGEATVGASMLARLYEAQTSFKRLAELKKFAMSHAAMTLESEQHGTRILDISTVRSLIAFLEEDAVEIEDQHASLRTISGYFLPMYNPKYSSDTLNYYRQREWRITQMWLRDGEAITPKCNNEQKEQLLAIDKGFFEKRISMLDTEGPRVEFCNYLPRISGDNLASTIRRIIAPTYCLREVEEVVRTRNLKTAVCALESLSD